MIGLFVSSASPSGDGGVFLTDLGLESARPLVTGAAVGALLWEAERSTLHGIEHGAAESLVSWRWDGVGLTETSRHALPGAGSCSIARVDARLVIAQFFSGTVVVLDTSTAPETPPRVCHLRGSGPEAGKQDSPHPHHVLPGGAETLVTDFGADRIWRIDPASATVQGEIVLPAGSGPRHTVRLSDQQLAVTGELDCTLLRVQLPGEEVVSAATTRRVLVERIYPSDLAVHRSGRVIVANRQAGTLGVIDPDANVLVAEVDALGAWPLNLEMIGDALFVTQRDDDAVQSFDVSRDAPTPMNRIAIPRPQWVVAGPAVGGSFPKEEGNE